jgi:LysR family transcriptional regulator, nod-box dependent transcriptional activator
MGGGRRRAAMNLNRLDLNLLVALDALLTERSITHAGERLHLSPSATSGALARLRDYFDDELLTQIGRRMVPTPLGESLQGAVRDCLLHIQQTVEIRPQFNPATSTRNFTIMMSDFAATVLMPGVLRQLQTEAPGVTFELLANDNEPWEALNRGEIDFLVLPRRFVRPDHPSQVLFEEEYVCVCWAGNSAVGDTLSLEQFLQLGHVVSRPGKQRPPTIDAWFFERFGHSRRIEVVATTFTGVPHLLVGTNRLSVMHKRLAVLFCEPLSLRILPVPIEMPRLVEMMQWHKYRDRDPGRIWMTQVLTSAAG